MIRRLSLIVVSVVILLCSLSLPVFADEKERGLVVTPPRQYLEIDPGKTIKSSITVANLTKNPLDVRLSVEQFSVTNYTYEYKFDTPKEDWLRLEKTEVTLEKTESRTISYTVSAPENARPGGHYFTIFASTSLGEGKQIRTATVLYVTASGDVTKNSSIVQSSVPFLSLGGDIPLRMDVQNSGNTHFIIQVQGEVKGLLSQATPPSEVAHVLLPDTTRTIAEKLPSPLLPGLYKVIYGYRDEEGHETKREQYMVYTPLWSFALIAGIAWFIYAFMKRRKREPLGKSTDS